MRGDGTVFEMSHPSVSTEQQAIEPQMRDAIAEKLGVRWTDAPSTLQAIRLDAYASAGPDGRPVLVEVFAHVGKRKAGQNHKIARDMTKLLFAEHLLGGPGTCTKLLVLAAVGDDRHPLTGWPKDFAEAFTIDTKFVELDPVEADALKQAQERQRR